MHVDVEVLHELVELVRGEAHAIVAHDQLRFWEVCKPLFSQAVDHILGALSIHGEAGVLLYHMHHPKFGRQVDHQKEFELDLLVGHLPFGSIHSNHLPRLWKSMSRSWRNHLRALTTRS